MSAKERIMSFIKEGHMSQFKAGKIKDKEQFVICKLSSRGPGERPEIHVFTDGSTKEPSSVVKVKSFAAVGASDQVPKIVKARYDNYIFISGSGGKATYLRTDTREQRDEWCMQLQALISQRTTTNPPLTPQRPLQPHRERTTTNPLLTPQQPLQPHRERTQTDSASNRPATSRNPRRGKSPITAPGSMQGIFQDELSELFKKRSNRTETIEEADDSQICCGLNHLECGSSHDAHCQDPSTYQNIHHVHSMKDWRREHHSSKHALKKTQELYQDFHQTSNMIQVQHEEDENEYETPEYRRDPLPETSNRLSGCSTSSEDTEDGASAMSAAQSLRSHKVPEESSWPPSPASSDDSETEHPARNPASSFTRELLGARLQPVREPEASLCLDDEQIYENTSVSQMRLRADLRRAASLKTSNKPHLPPRKSSLPLDRSKPVPPKLPEKSPIIKMKAQCRKLKEEKLSAAVTVCLDKLILVRHLSHLSLMEINDCINVTDVPRELKDFFRVGDQWLKVNDSYLNGVKYAQNCVEMSDKTEIEITFKRIPFGTICDFPWDSNNVDDIGLILNGNEIERVYPEGLAHLQGSLQSNDTTCLHSAGLRCNYVITEINCNPVNPNAATQEVWQMIKDAGGHIILILHPVDFRTRQRGYDMDDDCLYENVGC